MPILLGNPIRVPVGNFTIGPRIWLLDPALNSEGITWEAFNTDPELMFQVLLKYKYHLHHYVVHDIEMGIPESGWEVFVEFCNVVDAAWLGCAIHYPPGQVIASTPRYTGGSEKCNLRARHARPVFRHPGHGEGILPVFPGARGRL